MRPGLLMGALTALFLALQPVQAQSVLELEVFVADSPAAPTSTLVMGQYEAILIDTQFRLSDAERLADRIRASGRDLVAVYITQPHPDHYLGLATIADAFPGARILALPMVAAGMEGGWRDRLADLREVYGDEVPDHLPPPEFLDSDTLTLEGQTLRIVGPIAGDAPGASSYVWLPSLRTVIASDVVFSNAHIPVPGSLENLSAWETVLEEMAALEPRRVITGHAPDGAMDDPAAISFTLDYLTAYRHARAAATNAPELEKALLRRFPDMAMEWMTEVTAREAFPDAP